MIAMKFYIITEFLMSILYTTDFFVTLVLHIKASTTLTTLPQIIIVMIVIEGVRQIVSLILTTYFLLVCNSYLQKLLRDERLKDGATVDYEPMRNEEYDMNVI